MSQNNNFVDHVLRKKTAAWPDIIQQPVNASSRRIGVKTARLDVGCKQEVCMDLILDFLDSNSPWVRQEPD